MQLEHAGFAGLSAAEWADAYSLAMLTLSAHLAASIARRFEVPVVWLSSLDLRKGKRGFTLPGEYRFDGRNGSELET